MKTKHAPAVAAFTRVELLVVIAVLIILAGLLIPASQRAADKSRRITCVNNLKEIGTAYRIWANDNGEQFPAAAPDTNGGWNSLLSRTNAAAYCWVNYARLGGSPAVLVCPADERRPAATLASLVNNTNLSYFVGVYANDTYPQSLLGGDRNLGPGTVPDPEYGYSPSNGQGNDVVINGPVCWSLKMHSRGNLAGSGNILLGDGSAQQVTSGSLTLNWLPATLPAAQSHPGATNPAGVRLIFP